MIPRLSVELDASELFGGISSLTFSAEVLPYLLSLSFCLRAHNDIITILHFYKSSGDNAQNRY